MAGIIDFENLQIIIFNKTSKSPELRKRLSYAYHIGQLIHLQLCCKVSNETLGTFKIPHPPRSPASLNVLANLKRQLANSLDIRCSVRGLKLSVPDTCDSQHSPFVKCQVTLSEAEDKSEKENLTTEPFLSKDRRFYHIPIDVRIPDIPSCCRKAEISVHVRPSCKLGPRWLSSPSKPESPSFEDSESSSPLAGKTVTEVVRVIHPPNLMVQQNHVGNQEMIFLNVKNSCPHPLTVAECSVIPDTCPKSTSGSQYCSARSDTRNVCVFHASMIRMIPTDERLLPALLQPGECVSLGYTLDLTQCEASFSKDDVVLAARVKWSIYTSSDEGDQPGTSVITSYRLHGLKLRKGLFVLSARCEDTPLKKGHSFTVTYTIHNRLQDFLSIKLYWSPVLADDSCESARRFEKLQNCLICHDPSIQLGSCQYGDTVQAKVMFSAISKGFYEVCKHMKINLRYLIPAPDNDSLASPTSQCSATSEDHSSLVPDISWRSRSGSGSSASSARALSDRRNITSSNKSYSLGDLGPNNDEDTDLFKKSRSDKSPALPRRDPKLNVMSASKYEQMLLSPGNFIKNTCLIMVE